MLKNLKLLRNKNHISQQQLADIIGVSQQSINKYENHNVEPDIASLISIAEFFNTSVDFLIGHTTIDRVMEEVAEYDLNDEEAFLINSFRKLNKREKESILLIINNYLAHR